MKPWREVAVPHPDVLEGTFLQSEFAADITAVHTGQAKGKGQGQAHAGQGRAQDQAKDKGEEIERRQSVEALTCTAKSMPSTRRKLDD